MIDGKHRLRKERVVKHKANVFKDVKFFITTLWKALFCRKKVDYHTHYGSM